MGLVPAWTVAVSEYSAPGWIYVLDADKPRDWQGLIGYSLVASLAPVRVVGFEHGTPVVRLGTRGEPPYITETAKEQRDA